MQFGYGYLVDKKLTELNWTEDQYNFFLRHLQHELNREQLVLLLLELADAKWLESVADGIGTFEVEGK